MDALSPEQAARLWTAIFESNQFDDTLTDEEPLDVGDDTPTQPRVLPSPLDQPNALDQE